MEVWGLDDESDRLFRKSHNNGGAASSWWCRDPNLPSTDALSFLESLSNVEAANYAYSTHATCRKLSSCYNGGKSRCLAKQVTNEPF